MPAKLYIFLLGSIFSTFAIANDNKSLPFFIVHFETGPKWEKSLPPKEQTKFKEHSENMKSLRNSGSIVFGARYGDLGMIILKEKSLKAAKLLIENDPGVRSGIFEFRIEKINIFYPWQQ